MQLPARYPYNPGWKPIVGCFLLFGGGLLLMIHEALNNRRGLVLENFIHLGPTGATRFYWSIAAASGAFVLMALLLTLRRIANPQVLELEVDSLVLPHGTFQRYKSRIRYADIQQMSEIHVGKQTLLHLFTGQRKFTMAATLFPDEASYKAVKEFLASRMTPKRPMPPQH